MSVYCECCVLSGRGLCDELITRPEESYRLWCVVVYDLDTSWMNRPWPTGVLLWQKRWIKYLRLKWRTGNYKLSISNKEQIGNVLAYNYSGWLRARRSGIESRQSIRKYLNIKKVKKGKVIPLQDQCGPEVRGIALPFHDRGTRRGWVVSSTPRPHFTPGKDQISILQEAGWVPGPVWTGGKSRPHRDSIPDRQARSQSLNRLSYPAHI